MSSLKRYLAEIRSDGLYQSLADHDRRFHPHGLTDHTRCVYRNRQRNEDDADRISESFSGAVGALSTWLPNVPVILENDDSCAGDEAMFATQEENDYYKSYLREHRNGELTIDRRRDGTYNPHIICMRLPDRIKAALVRGKMIPKGMTPDMFRLAMKPDAIDEGALCANDHPGAGMLIYEEGVSLGDCNHWHGVAYSEWARLLDELDDCGDIFKGKKKDTIAVRTGMYDEKSGQPAMCYCAVQPYSVIGPIVRITDAFGRTDPEDYWRWEHLESEGMPLLVRGRKIKKFPLTADVAAYNSNGVARHHSVETPDIVSKVAAQCQVPKDERDVEYVLAYCKGDFWRCFDILDGVAKERGYSLKTVSRVTKQDGQKEDVTLYMTADGRNAKSSSIEYDGQGGLLLPSSRFDVNVPSTGPFKPSNGGRARFSRDPNFRFMRKPDGKIAGWYDKRNGGSVHLVRGVADTGTVAHEIGWHATFAWAKRNMPSLHAKLMEYAENAPRSVRDAVIERYGTQLSAEALLDEIGAERFTREHVGQIRDAVERRASKAWWDGVNSGQREAKESFVNSVGSGVLTRDELETIASLSPSDAVEKLVEAMIGGRSLEKEGQVGMDTRFPMGEFMRYLGKR